MATVNISLTKLRPKIPEILDRVGKYFDRCVIIRHGRPEAVIISSDDYENLMETLDILSDSKLMRDIRKGQQELASRKGVSWDKAKAMLGYV